MAQDYRMHNEDRYKQALDHCFNFMNYIEKLQCDSVPPQNPNYAPSTTFWLVDDDDNIVAVSRLRHYLVPRIQKKGGHIGYDVSPSFRKKGYGTLLLRLTKEKAKEFGLNKLLITCDSDNIGSSKIILNNGGILENEITSEQSGKKVLRYWIEL